MVGVQGSERAGARSPVGVSWVLDQVTVLPCSCWERVPGEDSCPSGSSWKELGQGEACTARVLPPGAWPRAQAQVLPKALLVAAFLLSFLR